METPYGTKNTRTHIPFCSGGPVFCNREEKFEKPINSCESSFAKHAQPQPNVPVATAGPLPQTSPEHRRLQRLNVQNAGDEPADRSVSGFWSVYQQGSRKEVRMSLCIPRVVF